MNGKVREAMVETEVVEKAKRRQYTTEYKLRILREVDACKERGEVGALLRREGLYSSLVSKWRQQCERGSLAGLGSHKRGPKADTQATELARLKCENERLRKRLEQAELIIDVQKKVAQMLGSPSVEQGANEAS
jgi:transposase-like protein